MTQEGFCPQVGDAVTLKVLRPGEGLATPLFCANETAIVVVFSEEREEVKWQCNTPEHRPSV